MGSSGRLYFAAPGINMRAMHISSQPWILIVARVAAGGYEQEVEELIQLRLRVENNDNADHSKDFATLDAKIDRARNMAGAWREWGAGR